MFGIDWYTLKVIPRDWKDLNFDASSFVKLSPGIFCKCQTY